MKKKITKEKKMNIFFYPVLDFLKIKYHTKRKKKYKDKLLYNP